VIGEKEVAEGTVTLRKRGVEQQETVKIEVFIERLQRTIKTRSVEFLD
jgi:threonyl-tRNA synthetase